jgi:hypothetical protein
MAAPDIRNFVDSLLARSPQAPNSLQLEIDTDGDPCSMFEVLLMIMTDILKRWYAPPITIGNITPEDGGRLAAYFASFGIAFHFTSEEEPRVLRINNREYLQQSRLEDMKFKVAHGGRVYTVAFGTVVSQP